MEVILTPIFCPLEQKDNALHRRNVRPSLLYRRPFPERRCRLVLSLRIDRSEGDGLGLPVTGLIGETESGSARLSRGEQAAQRGPSRTAAPDEADTHQAYINQYLKTRFTYLMLLQTDRQARVASLGACKNGREQVKVATVPFEW